MKRGKYVVGEIQTTLGLPVPGAILISSLFEHSVLEAAFESVTSAGFFNINSSGEVTVYGHSISLKLESNPDEDLPHVRRALGLETTEWN